MKLSTLLLILYVVLPYQSSLAQSDETKTVQELKIALEQLQAENQQLRKAIELHHKNAQAQGEHTEDLQVHERRRLLTELNSRVADLQEERKFTEAVRVEQVRTLERELAQLKEHEDSIHTRHETISAAPSAVQIVAERMAQAEVENRLRNYEAKAMMEVLEKLKMSKQVKHDKMLDEARALVELRQKELRTTVTSGANPNVVDQLNSKLEEANRIYETAFQNLQATQLDIDNRLMESAIEFAVSEQMDKAFGEEMARIKKLLSVSSESNQLKSQVKQLQEQIQELKLAASEEVREQKARLLIESNKVEREVLFPLKLRERVLIDSVGAGHPSIAILRTEIEEIQKQIATLRESEEKAARDR